MKSLNTSSFIRQNSSKLFIVINALILGKFFTKSVNGLVNMAKINNRKFDIIFLLFFEFCTLNIENIKFLKLLFIQRKIH